MEPHVKAEVIANYYYLLLKKMKGYLYCGRYLSSKLSIARHGSHALSSSIHEVEAGGICGQLYIVTPGQPGLHIKTLPLRKKKKKKKHQVK